MPKDGKKKSLLKHIGNLSHPLSSSDRMRKRATESSDPIIRGYYIAANDFEVSYMKLGFIATTALISTICFAVPAKAENPAQVRQLIVTGQCKGCDLTGANLKGEHLIGADLRDANLAGANLAGANLEGADLTGANLKGANLSQVLASDASLVDTNLTGVNLSNAKLYSTDMDGAILAGTNFKGAQLYGANVARLE